MTAWSRLGRSKYSRPLTCPRSGLASSWENSARRPPPRYAGRRKTSRACQGSSEADPSRICEARHGPVSMRLYPAGLYPGPESSEFGTANLSSPVLLLLRRPHPGGTRTSATREPVRACHRSSPHSASSAARSRMPPVLAPIAWRLTCRLLPGVLCLACLTVLADVVAGGWVAVLGAGWPPGSGFAGFWRAGGAGGHRADAAKSPADSGGGEPAGRGGAFPGAAQVGGERAGEPELGVAGDHDPGPAVGGVRVADFGGGPAEDLFEQAEGVLEGRSGAKTPASTGPPPLAWRWGVRPTARAVWGHGRRAGGPPAAGLMSPP
jgi:hypothetical protein